MIIPNTAETDVSIDRHLPISNKSGLYIVPRPIECRFSNRNIEFKRYIPPSSVLQKKPLVQTSDEADFPF